MHGPKKLPREVAPGVFWLGDCLEQRQRGKVYHSYNAAFLVVGRDASLLVETGHPKDYPVMERQLNEILGRGAPPLKHLFITHQETPHSGGLGRVLKRFPGVTVHGDVSDYHLAFPEHAHQLHSMKVGDAIDLGDSRFVAVEPVIRDLRTSLWGFWTKGNVLFPGDGFAYSHYHEDGHCGLLAEEATSLDLKDVSAVFAELALFWTKFADMNIYVEHLERMLKDLDVQTICPTHGLPITDLARTVPKVKEGLLFGGQAPVMPRPHEMQEALGERLAVS
ncbi:MAG TPA: MBL fold metallo-hydrolase [Chthoniobacterales bacterium]